MAGPDSAAQTAAWYQELGVGAIQRAPPARSHHGPEHFLAARKRASGFCEEAAARGARIPPDNVRYGEWSERSGREAAAYPRTSHWWASATGNL